MPWTSKYLFTQVLNTRPSLCRSPAMSIGTMLGSGGRMSPFENKKNVHVIRGRNCQTKNPVCSGKKGGKETYLAGLLPRHFFEELPPSQHNSFRWLDVYFSFWHVCLATTLVARLLTYRTKYFAHLHECECVCVWVHSTVIIFNIRKRRGPWKYCACMWCRLVSDPCTILCMMVL